jgi:hypothetical protein
MSHIDSDITGGASLGGDPYRVGSPTIDEVSPEEDERFAESVIHNKHMSLSFSTRIYSVSAPNTDIPASTTMGECDMYEHHVHLLITMLLGTAMTTYGSMEELMIPGFVASQSK